MSIEAQKVEETTPAPVAKPVDAAVPETTPATETSAAAATSGEAAKETETAAPEVPAKDDTAVEASPATEGSLGYKAPGLLKQFRYVKHFFWFSEEPLTQEALDSYVKGEKADVAHHHAAWAQETGKGVLFFAKRAEDKAHPTGLILLPEATAVTKIGATDFSFKVGTHTHKFEASSATERDSWVVSIQKVIDESKDLKADVTGRESYKKTLEGYAFSPAIIGASSAPTKSDSPQKSGELTAAAPAATEAPETKTETPVEEAKKEEAEKKAKKERSQSRKRNSVFGLFGKKDEEKAAEKAEKEHEKEVKKAEAEHKKEEAKAEHDASKAKDAAEAAAVAALPAAVVASTDKKEESKSDEPVSPSEKKSKRASVFGGFFGKTKLSSPTSEKTAEEAGPAVPAKEETSAVSETAPKLDEPIDTKPIDAAAVTAPVDNAEHTVAPVTGTTEEHKATEPAAATTTDTTHPKAEKKGFLAGLIKKVEHKKEEHKEEPKTNDEAAKEAATPAGVATTEAATTEPASDTPAKEGEVAKEERPAREKRRTSLFGSLGTLKRKNEKSPEPSSATADEAKTDTKREKSPLPAKLGGLFRRPSRAAKSEKPAEEVKPEATTDAAVEAPKATEGTPAAATTETPATATVVEPKGDSQIVGDVVPENLHTTVHDAVTDKPAEVKATA